MQGLRERLLAQSVLGCGSALVVVENQESIASVLIGDLFWHHQIKLLQTYIPPYISEGGQSHHSGLLQISVSQVIVSISVLAAFTRYLKHLLHSYWAGVQPHLENMCDWCISGGRILPSMKIIKLCDKSAHPWQSCWAHLRPVLWSSFLECSPGRAYFSAECYSLSPGSEFIYSASAHPYSSLLN